MIQLLSALLLAALLLAACGPARRVEPLGSAVRIETVAEAHGQKVFMRHCHQCHTHGAGALGPGLNDKPLPGFVIRMQVRHGFGAMPAFSRDVIGDDELDDIVAYLRAARRSAPAYVRAAG